MTSFMGQRKWKESWSDNGGRRNSLDCNVAPKTGPGSPVSSVMTDYSLDRCNTRASFLLREQSTLSSHVDSTNYQEKLQGWSAIFHDNPVAPRPGTSINSVRTHPVATSADVDRDISFLREGRSVAFPTKPRELYDPLDGIMPSNRLVSQRKYYVLPSIGHHDLLMRRQHSSMDTLNQLDYSREQFEDDAEFFAQLMELKKESSQSCTPHPNRSSVNPLPPIQKLKDVVRPRTNIAESDEDRITSRRDNLSVMSYISDLEAFRANTPDPDYADTSPTKLSVSSDIKPPLSVRRSYTGSPVSVVSVPVIDTMYQTNES